MIYFYGAGGHAKVVLEILKLRNFLNIKVLDDNKQGSLLDLPIYNGPLTEKLSINDNLVIAIGDNKTRKIISEKYPYVKNVIAVHPSSNISSEAVLGRGTVVMAGVSINVDVRIGEYCIINTNCSVDHDTKIEDFVHLSPNVAVAGNVEIGEGAQIGIGACVIQGIKIGNWATVGAGAVVIKDIPDYAVVVGNPGRIIKFNSKF